MEIATLASALVSGIAAGLALAIPLGAIGALLFTVGLRHGFRRGWPAAAGVGAADGIYAIVAVVFGAIAAPLVAALQPWPAVVGGAIVIAIAILGIVRHASASAPSAEAIPADVATRPIRRFTAFLALTLVNPMTLLSFVAISTGIGDLVQSAPARVAFVVGVFLGSAAWQCLLVAAGAVLATRIRPVIYTVTLIGGNVLIATLGAFIILNAVAP